METRSRPPLALLRGRSWAAPLIAMAVAVLVRVPNYDVAWFGVDQVFFMMQARRVLAGDWNVTGPLASGLNIVGPLYSYLLAALLWIREDPAFAAAITLWFGVLATWFVFDATRRMTSARPALIAAVSYAVAPALVEGTRLVWNPSLLPPLLAVAWWAVVRYVQAPSTGRIALCGLLAGLLIPMHITGVFGAAGIAAAAALCRRPELTHVVAGTIAAMAPMVPGVIRLTEQASDVTAFGQRLGGNDWASTLEAIAITCLQLPGRVWLDDWSWSVWGAIIALYWQAAAAIAGAAIGIWRGGKFRSVWIGITLSIVLHVIGTRVYGGTLDWYYFLALIPPLCLLVACFTSAIRPRALAMAVVMMWTLGIAAQATFIYQFDTRVIARGLITVDENRLGVRLGRAIAHAIPLRELRVIGEGLRRIVPNGATALAAAHGARGELWRESGAEFLPAAAAPDPAWPWQLVLMGSGIQPIAPHARVLPGRVCASIATAAEWRMQHPPAGTGWEQPGFDDTAWPSIPVPRRTARPSPGGFAPVSEWRAPQMMARGRFRTLTPRSPHLIGIAIRGAPVMGRAVQAFVNGQPLPLAHRTMNSSIASTDEWLLDATSAVITGPNTIALFVDGILPAYDFDVFDVSCVDDDWYRLPRDADAGRPQ